MSERTSKAPVVDCPTCHGPSEFSPNNHFRPFCCERCKQIDLGAWASESFRVPSSPTDPNEPPEGTHLN